MSRLRDPNYVCFDVGGDLYTVSKDTLVKFPDSFLAKCVSPSFDRRKDPSEFILIDRDGEYFKTIISFMNDERSLDLRGWHEEKVQDLMEEADFYGLVELIELCQSQLDTFVESKPGYIELVVDTIKMKKLLDLSERPVLVFSIDMILNYEMNTEMWIDEVVKYCDLNKYNIYLFRRDFYDNQDDKILEDDHMVAFYSNGRVGKPKFLKGFLRHPDGQLKRPEKFSSQLYKSRLFAFLLLIGREVISTKTLSRRLRGINSDYWP